MMGALASSNTSRGASGARRNFPMESYREAVRGARTRDSYVMGARLFHRELKLSRSGQFLRGNDLKPPLSAKVDVIAMINGQGIDRVRS